MNVLITGSNKGIGYGLVKQFLERTNAHVIATCRDPANASLLHELSEKHGKARLQVVALDVRNVSAFDDLRDRLLWQNISTIDVLIGNAAISNPDHPHDSFLQCNPEEMMNIFQTNVIGNMKLLQTFHKMVADSSLKLTLIMSSVLGSKEYAAATGGVTSYRVSKSALNMLCVLYASDPAVKGAGIQTLIMHPGHVSTDMGLSGGQQAKIDLDQSTMSILQCIERVAAKKLSQMGKGAETFQFSESLQEIEKREHFQDMLNRLEETNFVYVQWDGSILDW